MAGKSLFTMFLLCIKISLSCILKNSLLHWHEEATCCAALDNNINDFRSENKIHLLFCRLALEARAPMSPAQITEKKQSPSSNRIFCFIPLLIENFW